MGAVEDVRAKYIHRTTAIAIATFGTMCPLLGSLLSVMRKDRRGRELFGMSSGNTSRGATARAGDSGVAERMATIRVASMTCTGELRVRVREGGQGVHDIYLDCC